MAGEAEAAAANTPAWHADVPADVVGKWQAKGYDLKDPKTVAISATKAYMEAEGFVGLPADQVLKLPKTPADPGWDQVYQRLGAPADPKDYDFAAVKKADGQPLDAPLQDHFRATAATLHLSKDAAVQMATAEAKRLDAANAAAVADKQATLATQRAALDQNWGANKDAFMVAAKQAAGALGVTKEQLAALENTIGYDKVMNLFLDISKKIGEDKFISGNPNSNAGVMTKEQAQTSLNELKRDAGWAARLLAGDVATVRQSAALAAIIAGDDTQDSRRRGGR